MNIAYILSILLGMLPLVFKTSKRLENLEEQIKKQKTKLIAVYLSRSITYESLWDFLDQRESLLRTQRGTARIRKVHIVFLSLGIIFGGLGFLFSYVLPQITIFPISCACACIVCIMVNGLMTIYIAFSRTAAEISSEEIPRRGS